MCSDPPPCSWTARAMSVGGVAGEVGGERVGCWAPVAPMPVLRSGPGSWIPWTHSWPWVLISARGSRAHGKLSSLGEGCIREKGKKGKERNPLQHTWGAEEGGRQRSPHPKERYVVGYLLKSPRGSSRASPHPHSSHRSWVSSLGGPDRAGGQGGRQMGLREMGSSGHPKATDSNAPGGGGTSCPLQGHHLEKVPRPVPPHVQGPS